VNKMEKPHMQIPIAIDVERAHLAKPETIVVATDLTDAEILVPHAVAQAKATGARIRLVHAIDPRETFSVESRMVVYQSRTEEESRVELALRGMASEIETQGVACEVRWRHGYPADVVPEQIAESGATRLIMASHGRGKLGQFLLGSVANHLLGKVSVPVFIAGPQSLPSGSHATPRRILHPVSMNGDYKESAKLAIQLARLYRAELTMLHIPDRDIEKSLHPGCTLCWAKNLFAKLVPEGADVVPPLRIDLAFGDKVEQIRDAAKRTEADWIVMGVDEGFSLWPLTENTAYRVLSVAGCPVLAIRRRAHSPEEQKSAKGPCLVSII
jgi:nucleotide-binding universal stress UspA family protein